MTVMTEEMVFECYRCLLGRDPESNDRVKSYTASNTTLENMLLTIVNSTEFKARSERLRVEGTNKYLLDEFSGHRFLSIDNIASNYLDRAKILLIGSCFIDGWKSEVETLFTNCRADSMHIEMLKNPDEAIKWSEYNYCVVQIPLRHIFPDSMYLNLIRNGLIDESIFTKTLDAVAFSLGRWIDLVSKLGPNIPVFFVGMLKPQFEIDGRLCRSTRHLGINSFMEKLNDRYEKALQGIPNLYFIDADCIAQSVGRRYVQEDSVWIFSHGGLLSNFDYSRDEGRIEPVFPLSWRYELHNELYLRSVLMEIDQSYRIVKSRGAIKMVCFDLDDTLWRGVLAERDFFDAAEVSEGWPRGIIEAASILKRRGVILCLLSKNDPENVHTIWHKIYGTQFPLSEFAILKINWNDKSVNLREAIIEANIGPDQVLVVDDNPLERNELRKRVAGIRTIESPHYYWKRILLQAPELQNVTISEESKYRNDTIKSKRQREEFLGSIEGGGGLKEINVRVEIFQIGGHESPRFARTLELINKTNQFNTTGARYTIDELDDLCKSGIVLVGQVADIYTNYGLVGAIICRRNTIEAFVLSCRVFKMNVELALLSELSKRVENSSPLLTGMVN